MNDLSNQFSLSLAELMTKKEIRAFLKNEALKQFDGDYDILFAKAKNESITTYENGRSLSMTFGEYIDIGSAEQRSTSASLLSSLADEYPTMEISIPSLDGMDPASWDVSEDELLVAVLPVDADDQTIVTIEAFDSDGIMHVLDAHIEPDHLVAVVGISERVTALEVGSLEEIDASTRILTETCSPPEAIFSDAQFDYYLDEELVPYNSCVGGGGTGDGDIGGGTGSGSSCDRDNKNSEDIIWKAKFKSMGVLRQVEPWAWGKPEVDLYVSHAVFNNNNPTTRTRSYTVGKDGWMDGGWLNRSVKWKKIDAELFVWESDEFGDMMVYNWLEDDKELFGGGATWNSDLSISFLDTSVGNVNFSGEASFSIGGMDDHISETDVHYCDPTGYQEKKHDSFMKFYLFQEVGR